MKLHKIKANAPTFVKRISDDEFTKYTTKEDRTYFAEQVSDELQKTNNFNLYENIQVDGETVTLRSSLYSRVVSDDGEWIMIVPNEFIHFYCNLED